MNRSDMPRLSVYVREHTCAGCSVREICVPAGAYGVGAARVQPAARDVELAAESSDAALQWLLKAAILE